MDSLHGTSSELGLQANHFHIRQMKHDFRGWMWYLEEFIIPIAAIIAVIWIVYAVMSDAKVEWDSKQVPGRVAK